MPDRTPPPPISDYGIMVTVGLEDKMFNVHAILSVFVPHCVAIIEG